MIEARKELLDYYYKVYSQFTTFEKVKEFKKNELKKRDFFLRTWYNVNYMKYIDRREYNFISGLFQNNFEGWEKYVLKDYYNFMYCFFWSDSLYYKKVYLSFLCYLHKMICENIKEIKED